MMPTLACAAWGFRKLTPAQYFAAAHRLGLDAVEINLDEGESRHLSPAASEAELAQTLRVAADAGIRIVAVAGGNDFTSADAFERTRQVDAMRRQLDICAILSVKVIRVFAGFIDDKQVSDEIFGRAIECFARVAPYAESLGVTLAMENHGGITKTGAECMRLLRDLPPIVGLNYDPANFRHVDEDPLSALEVCRERIVYSHWKDVRLAGGEWEYCAMGEGVIAWQPIVDELKSFYDGIWAIEYEEPADIERGTRVSLECLKAHLA